MLTEEEKQWCREMAVAMRLKYGAHQMAFSEYMKLAFLIDLN
jgi:hypothetical protein